jgi:hypothetical protein
MDMTIFIPAVVMLTPVLILLILMRHRAAMTKERYQTLLQLADKGLELPHELLVEPLPADTDRRRALVLMSAGFGLITMFVALPIEFESGQRLASLWGIGLLPLMIGLGYLASWWLNRRDTMRG